MKNVWRAGAALAALAACVAEAPTALQCDPVPAGVTATRGDTMVTATGLRFLEIRVGAGEAARSCTAVQVRFLARLTSGQQVDSATHAFVLGRGRVIAGFEQGVVGMRPGGARRLIVPPELAYGGQTVLNPQTGEVAIPPNSTLIFNVELDRVESP